MDGNVMSLRQHAGHRGEVGRSDGIEVIRHKAFEAPTHAGGLPVVLAERLQANMGRVIGECTSP